ncbi:helix-turn-helix domain-containing protein [Roseomonas stagni]|uniref:Helix-turn-helix domain-containing protein n=1 Tax=Falsiroseomonas algicola TaxID=2716930 RepID=A0A6M1LW07_9PROT|nr:helix-turn-helix domain-containing protein [Falsiroseomonas algicola]NGM24162.1 helix-turn-helix domain-containing protein [Falsiroseomonas algicola]
MHYDRSDQGGAQQSRGHHLKQHELAERWKVSGRTLEKWRQTRRGPPYLLIGGAVRYRIEDVLAYEASRLQEALR